MIQCSHPQPKPSIEICNFIRQRIGLSQKALELGIRQSASEHAPLPIVLWTLGLITLNQYQDLITWQFDR